MRGQRIYLFGIFGVRLLHCPFNYDGQFQSLRVWDGQQVGSHAFCFIGLQKRTADHLVSFRCMTSQKISAVINTYNAERYLAEVLNSLRYFDEIVVCDMESNDSTCEIASKFGCKIVTFPKGNIKICEPARDFAIHSATNNWVLVVDADELVPKTLCDYLYEAIADGTFNDAFAIPRINLFKFRKFFNSPFLVHKSV